MSCDPCGGLGREPAGTEPSATSPATLGKLCVALCAAMLIVLLGQLMATQLPDSYPPPAPISSGSAPPASGQPPHYTLPSGPADLNSGSSGFPPQSLTVNQGLP